MKLLNGQSPAAVLCVLAAFVLALLAPAQAAAQAKETGSKININTATVAELQELPRIGEQVARRIVEYREQNGKFKRIEELMKIKGIGEKTFLQLKDRITVGDSGS